MAAEFVSSRRITILQFREIIKPILTNALAPGTVKLSMAAWASFARIVGNIPVRSITPFQIELFKSKRLAEVSPEKVSIDLRRLCADSARAYRLRITDCDPFDNCIMIRIPSHEPRYVTEAELIAVLRVVGSDLVMQVLIVMAAATGMRLGELVALLWVQVNVEDGVIYLQNRGTFTLKNRKPRIVPLGEIACRMISLLPKSSAHVFTDRSGNPFKVGTVSRKFKRYVRAAGLPEDIRFHSLRHSSGSFMAGEGVPPSYIQSILGHSSLRVTERYIHSAPDHLQKAVIALDPLLQRVLDQIGICQ